MLNSLFPCFGPETWAERFWKERLRTTGRPVFITLSGAGVHLDIILKFKTGGWGEEKKMCFFLPAPFLPLS